MPFGGGQSVPMRPTLNLADLADAATARENLGVKIGTDVQAYDADLAALAANGTNGLLARTGAGTAAARTITGTSNQVTVTNGDGVSGNPTLSLPQNIHAGASPSFTGLDLTGISDDGLLRIASGGVVKSSILETSDAPYLSPNKALRVLVPSFGSVATPVVTDAICGHADEVTDTVTNPAALSFANMFSANNGVHVDIYSRRTASADRILNTRHIANGGIQLAQCVTADPTGVASTIQLYGDVTNGYAMIREGTASARRIGSRLTDTATKSASYVAVVNENVICDANAADYDGTATRSGNVLTASGFTPENLAEFQVSGSVPGGLVAGARYWMKSVSGSTFEVSATPGGSSITLSGATSGITITGYSVPILFPATIAAGDEWGIELRTAHSVRTIMPHFQGFTVVGYSSHQPLRLIAAGEQLRFRAVDASTVVATQVRQTKQQTAMSLVSSVSSHYANAVFTKVPLDTTDYDVCSNADLANDTFLVRRSCKLAVCGEAYSLGVTSGVGEAQINVGSTGVAAGPLAPGTSLGCVGSVSAVIDVDAGESVTLSLFQNTGSAKEATGTASVNYLHCSEL